MRLIKCMCTTVLFFMAEKTFSQQPTTHEFSIQQCIDYAQKNNVVVKNALLDVQIQEQQNRAITAAAYPQVNASFNTQYNPNVTVQTFPNFIGAATYGVLEAEGVKDGSGNAIKSPTDFGFIEASFGTKYTANTGVTLAQTLFDGQVFVGLQARQTSIDYRIQSSEYTKLLVRTNVSKIYYQLSLSKVQVQLVDANINRTNKLLSDSRELYKNGFAEKLDVDRASVQLTNFQSQRQTTLNAIANGYLGLKLLMGMPINDSLVLTDSINAESIQQGALLTKEYKYDDRPDFRTLSLSDKLLEYNVRRYQLSKLPTASLNAGYSKLAQRNKYDFFSGAPWFTSSYIGLTVNVSIFGGFLKDANVKQAKLQLQQTNNSLAYLKLQIDEQVDSSIISFNNAIINLNNQKTNVDLATQVYDLTKKKYESGLASTTDISNAQTDLTTAQTNYLLALYSAALAKIDYLKATGKL